MSNKSKYVPYNGCPLNKETERLVPIIVDQEFIDLCQIQSKVRTWYRYGVYFKVAFCAVPKESYVVSYKAFNANLNDLLDEELGPNRSARCMIKQPDGSYKVCPKRKGNNHPCCKECPERGMWEREDKTMLSYETLEEMGMEILEDKLPDADDVIPLLVIALWDLMSNLKDQDARTYTVISGLLDGLDRNDIVSKIMEDFNLKQSRAYDVYKDAIKKIRDYLGPEF